MMHINWNINDRVCYMHYPGRIIKSDDKLNQAFVWFDDGTKRWIPNSKLTRLGE